MQSPILIDLANAHRDDLLAEAVLERRVSAALHAGRVAVDRTSTPFASTILRRVGHALGLIAA